jgi:hypothetical protein
VSKTVRAERKKERLDEENRNSVVLFGIQEEFIWGDARWINTESLVGDVLEECGADNQNVVKL